jgi:hypothetical protein
MQEKIKEYAWPIIIVLGLLYIIISYFYDMATKTSEPFNVHDYDYTETTIIRDNEGNVIDVKKEDGNIWAETRPYD